jgi:hypothetical protein
MTPNETETLLRETLLSHLDDVEPVADPWLRVSRAHRRSRTRRRTAAVGALASVATCAATLISTQPWQNRAADLQPAQNQAPVVIVDQPNVDTDPWGPGSAGGEGYLRLDDGRPRGALGSDPALRQDVIAALRNPGDNGIAGWKLTDPDRVRVLWADVRDGRRLALVLAVLDTEPPAGTAEPTVQPLIWVGEPAAGAKMKVMEEYNVASAIDGKLYAGADGKPRLLAVVRRGATVVGSRPTISTDGQIRRDWQPIPVQDGVVDISLADLAGRGPLTLRAQVDTGSRAYFSTRQKSSLTGQDFGVAHDDISPEQAAAATRDARGPGISSESTNWALTGVVNRFGTDAAHTAPRVEWSGPAPTSGTGTVIAVSAGLAGQGRMLQILRSGKDQQWFYERPVPAGNRPLSLAWRVPAVDAKGKAAGQVAGWLLGPDVTSVTITVDGVARPGTLQDGLGWIMVQPKQEVVVIGHRATGGDLRFPLHPKDARLMPPYQGDPLGIG